MDALRGGFGTIGSIIRARSARKMSMSSGPPGAEAFRHRHSYASGTEQHRSAANLMPGVQRHQLWDAPVPSQPTTDSAERISMQPPRQHHRSIRFGDEPVEAVGKKHDSSIQTPSTPSQNHGRPVPPTASQMITNNSLTYSPPAMRYDGLPPSSTTVVSPYEMIDPFTDDTKTARPVHYNSPSLESASSDSFDQQVVKSPRAHLYPRRNSDSDREESASLVANRDGSAAKGSEIRLVKRI
jgi:hypothetical protein